MYFWILKSEASFCNCSSSTTDSDTETKNLKSDQGDQLNQEIRTNSEKFKMSPKQNAGAVAKVWFKKKRKFILDVDTFCLAIILQT